MKTNSYVIGVRVAQRTNGADQRDVLTAREVGAQLLEALHACGAKDSGMLVEAEVIVGDEPEIQPQPRPTSGFQVGLLEERGPRGKVIPMPNVQRRITEQKIGHGFQRAEDVA